MISLDEALTRLQAINTENLPKVTGQKGHKGGQVFDL